VQLAKLDLKRLLGEQTGTTPVLRPPTMKVVGTHISKVCV
jgi:hypothetical protein